MRQRRTIASALAVLATGLAGAGPAHAGFVPALGSPFGYEAPTQSLAVADADRNGTLDVAAGGLALRRGAGTGFLAGPLTVGWTGGPAVALVAADLNGDGLLDYAAIAPGSPRRLMRFLALPAGGYAPETVLADVGAATDLAVAHLDGDRLADLVVVRSDDPPPPEPDPDAEPDPDPPAPEPPANVTVVYGNGAPPASFASGVVAPAAVTVADLDGDGWPEIVVAGEQPNVAVLAGLGGGSFAAGTGVPTGAVGVARRIVLADLDGDGRHDLMTSDSAAAVVRVLRGDGARGFAPLGARATGLTTAASSLAAADVDGDGRTDVLVGGIGAFALLLGDGGGGLSAAPGSPFPSGDPAGGPVEAIVAADMNHDGQPDVVAANRNGSVSVQLNDDTGLMAATPPGVDFGALLPASGQRATTVTLRSTRGRLRVTRLDRRGSRLFAVRDLDCVGRVLLRGQACRISVTFDAPRKARRYEALLSVDVNAPAIVLPLTATARPPVIRRPRLARKRLRAGQRLDLRYRLSEGALVRAVVERARPGRRLGRGRCVAPRRRNLRRPRCVIWERVARASRRDLAGFNRLRVATREAPRGRGRKRRAGPVFAPGVYRIVLTAADRFANRSPDARLRFRLLRRPGSGRTPRRAAARSRK